MRDAAFPEIDTIPTDERVDQALTKALLEIAEGLRLPGAASGSYGVAFAEEDPASPFSMRPYCWCERDLDCPWCAGTIDPEDLVRMSPEALGRFTRAGYVVGEGAPNFIDREGGLMIWWYKYPGRGMRANRPVTAEMIKALRQRFATWRATPEAARAVACATVEEAAHGLPAPLVEPLLDAVAAGRAEPDALLPAITKAAEAMRQIACITDELDRRGAPKAIRDPDLPAPLGEMALSTFGRMTSLLDHGSTKGGRDATRRKGSAPAF